MDERNDKVEAAIRFLVEAASYFERRPKKGEDASHWSNVYNSENCLAIAKLIKDMNDGR